MFFTCQPDCPRLSFWVAAWQGSPMTGGTFSSPGCPSDVRLTNQTARNIMYLSTGGDKVRVRISNACGATPLNVGAATVAISAGGAAIVPGTLRTLRFSGNTSIIIAADSEALSDPVKLAIPPLTTLAVSIFLPREHGPGNTALPGSADQLHCRGQHIRRN
jgi:hypothetical protein